MSCVSGELHSLPGASHRVRVLRWTFRRAHEAVICQLGLDRDESAYELRIEPAINPTGVTLERFTDATAAFQRHGSPERLLVTDGWSLDRFESQFIPR